jgi:hypothetical protein
MASIISAGNATNGLAVSSDNTGILELKTGTGAGTTALTLSTAQAATFASTVTSAEGTLYPLVSGTSVSASGTAVDFTGLPSWVRRVTVILSGISTNGTARVQVQIGPSGGVATTGYTSYSGMSAGNTSITTGFAAEAGSSAANWIRTGHFVLTLADAATNLWVYSAAVGILDSTTGYGATGGGNIALAGALSILRVTTVGGTNTFDAGTLNILYE